MNKSDLENVFIDAMMALRKSGIVPVDTGNLAYNAIKGMWVNDKTFRIYIDTSVAPYADFTIMVWSKGKNPNEGWFYKAMKFLADYIARRLGGQIG